MGTLGKVLLIVAIVLVALIVFLFIFGRKAQRKQAETEAQMKAYEQTMSMLIIDKKRMKMKDAGLPAMVMEQTPKLMRNSKLPVVKVKVGPQIMTMIADAKVFDQIPIKKEVKATVSGIYITGVKGIRGSVTKEQEKTKKKKSKFKTWVEKMQEKAGATPIK